MSTYKKSSEVKKEEYESDDNYASSYSSHGAMGDIKSSEHASDEDEESPEHDVNPSYNDDFGTS